MEVGQSGYLTVNVVKGVEKERNSFKDSVLIPNHAAAVALALDSHPLQNLAS